MKQAVFLFTALLCALPLRAEILNDPMRPPAGLGADPVPGAGPVLQSVFISSEKRYAIISGERVMEGGRYGESLVSRINTNEVRLRDGSGETVLKLYPDVHKIIVSPAKTATTGVTQGAKRKQQ